MIEINRKLYLEDDSNIKSNNFKEISELMRDYLDLFVNKYMINQRFLREETIMLCLSIQQLIIDYSLPNI